MAPPTVRRMALGDIPAVLAIDHAAYPTHWSEGAYRTEIANPAAVYIVAEDEGGDIAGYAGMWIVMDEMHVTTVAVRPERRRCGIARRMLLEMARLGLDRGATRLTLEVRSRNAPALALYEWLGFVRLGRRRGYYQDTGDDAIIMWHDDAVAMARLLPEADR